MQGLTPSQESAPFFIDDYPAAAKFSPTMVRFRSPSCSSRNVLQTRWYHSEAPFSSLNISFTVGDNKERVRANRERLKQCLKIKYLVSTVQVHGDRIVFAENISQDTEFSNADAIITNQSSVGLLIQQADCQAILLHDPELGVIAAVHNGWRGSSANIIGKTVNIMQERYTVHPANLRAVISPSLGPCCAEFKNYRLELPHLFHSYQVQKNYFDFWAISRKQLTDAGLSEDHIETTEICTVCNRNFFSYRREVRQGRKITGRNGSVIGLHSSTFL